MQDTLSALQTYGGWACTFFLGIALLRFYADFKKTVETKDKLIQQMNECHHKEIVAVVRECTAILTTVQVVLQNCKHNARGDYDGAGN